MALFQNASPEYLLLGADDKGGRTLPAERDLIPQHVPLIYMFAAKGTTNKMFAGGANAALNFGVSSFSPDSPYHTHTTQLASSMLGAGNACSIKRVIPTDAGPKANQVLYIDIVAGPVPNYVRDSLGNKVIDPITNLPTVVTATPTITGIHAKFVTQPSAGTVMGVATPKPGTMTVGGVVSTMYPIMEHRAAYEGEYYNNIGYAIESPTISTVDQNVLTATKSLTYRLSLVNRTTPGATPQVVRSLYGDPSVQFSLKPDAVDPTTQLKIDTKSVFDTNWFNETDPLKTIRFNEYSGMHVYTSNIELVTGMIMANEKTHLTDVAAVWNDGLSSATSSWFDFTTADPVALDTEGYLFNLFNGKSSKGISYFTYELSTATPTLAVGQKEVHISKDTPVFLEGGSDGTLTNAMFETVVNVELAKYLDPNSEVIDNAINVETHLYDSGFTLATKTALLNFIAVRKDSVVALGTHEYVAGSGVMPLADTRAVTTLLKTQAMLFPESEFFGTPVARAVVMGGAYKLYSSVAGEFYPLTFELAIKTARMMGGGNFKWKADQNFDHGPNAVLSQGYAYEPAFIPAGIKASLWNEGMVWAQPKDLSTYFIPAVQTVYDDDTSPMNNWYTVCGLVSLNRIASDAWREFTGTSTMSDVEFKEVVLNYLNERTQGIFDGLLVVVPDVIITDKDAARGYSWQVMFKLYAGNMKTKMVSYTEVYRLNDLTVV